MSGDITICRCHDEMSYMTVLIVSLRLYRLLLDGVLLNLIVFCCEK